jgi:hypothetical protein
MKAGRKINMGVTVVLAAAFLLVISFTSWAEQKLIVVRNTATNSLTATVCDSSRPTPCVNVTPFTGKYFTSSVLPTLGWDPAIGGPGGWTIVGMTSSMATWSGEIWYNEVAGTASLQSVVGTPEAPVSSSTSPSAPTYEPPFQKVVYEAPSTSNPTTCTYAYSGWGPCQYYGAEGYRQYQTAVLTSATPCSGAPNPTSQSCTPPCTWSYSAWGTCDPNTRTQTRTASGCTGTTDQPLSQSCTPTCSSWSYTAWTPSDATCAVGTTQTRTATGSPAPCTGTAPEPTQKTCGSVACIGYAYSAWGTCTNSTQTRTVTGYTPAGCSGTPATQPALSQSCTSGGDPAGTITLRQNDEEPVTVPAKGTKSFKFTTPAGGCSAYPLKWLIVTMINVDLTAGDGQLLVKSTNKGASAAWPTLADYTDLFAAKGYSLGQDWTRAGNGGVFFWRWTIGAPSEALVILPTYTGHTFGQDDTYYLLLYNQGTKSNQYRVMWQCS